MHWGKGCIEEKERLENEGLEEKDGLEVKDRLKESDGLEKYRIDRGSRME